MSLWMRPAALRAGVPRRIGPGAALVLAGGEEADQIEQRVAGADEAVARALCEAQVGEERRAVAGIELRDLGLHLRRQHHRLGAGSLGRSATSAGSGFATSPSGDVQHDEQRPQRQEGEARRAACARRR